MAKQHAKPGDIVGFDFCSGRTRVYGPYGAGVNDFMSGPAAPLDIELSNKTVQQHLKSDPSKKSSPPKLSPE